MKSVSFIPFFLFFLVSCSDKYELEDELCDCYRENIVNYDALLEEIESFYIAEGVLESSDGSSYKKRIAAVLSDPENAFFPEQPKAIIENFKLILSFNPLEECQEILEKDWEQTHWKKMEFRMKEIILKEHYIEMEQMYRASDEIFTNADFNHSFYKTYFFTTFMYNNSESVDLGVN